MVRYLVRVGQHPVVAHPALTPCLRYREGALAPVSAQIAPEWGSECCSFIQIFQYVNGEERRRRRRMVRMGEEMGANMTGEKRRDEQRRGGTRRGGEG